MDSDAFSASLFKWDLRGMPVLPNRLHLEASAPPQQHAAAAAVAAYAVRPPRELVGLDEMFQAYGVRYYTATKIAELGFTVNTLLGMKDDELDEMMSSVSHYFRWELLFGERYGIKAAVRAERRRLEEEALRRRHIMSGANTDAIDALSQEGLSEEPVQQDKETVGSGGDATWVVTTAEGSRKKKRGTKRVGERRRRSTDHTELVGDEDDGVNDNPEAGEQEPKLRQREHPFIVTELDEVARGKKNGLDYLFHLYDQCRHFLTQVQNIAKERGEKCPTKVTNQVYRYAKRIGATYINKPKMRHYVHCYALHILDEGTSNELRREFKLRGENVGSWREACYKPLVEIAARQDWDIDAIFEAHPHLSPWYVPTKLRQLCHAQRNRTAAVSSSVSGGSVTAEQLPY